MSSDRRAHSLAPCGVVEELVDLGGEQPDVGAGERVVVAAPRAPRTALGALVPQEVPERPQAGAEDDALAVGAVVVEDLGMRGRGPRRRPRRGGARRRRTARGSASAGPARGGRAPASAGRRPPRRWPAGRGRGRRRGRRRRARWRSSASLWRMRPSARAQSAPRTLTLRPVRATFAPAPSRPGRCRARRAGTAPGPLRRGGRASTAGGRADRAAARRGSARRRWRRPATAASAATPSARTAGSAPVTPTAPTRWLATSKTWLGPARRASVSAIRSCSRDRRVEVISSRRLSATSAWVNRHRSPSSRTRSAASATSSRSRVWSSSKPATSPTTSASNVGSLRRRHREQPAAGLGQPLQALVDDVLHDRRDEAVRIDPIGGSRRSEQAQQLDREEGVALGALVHELGQRAVRRCVEQRAGQLLDGVDPNRARAVRDGRRAIARSPAATTASTEPARRLGSWPAGAASRGWRRASAPSTASESGSTQWRSSIDQHDRATRRRRGARRGGRPRASSRRVRASSRPSSSAGALPPPSSTVSSGWAPVGPRLGARGSASRSRSSSTIGQNGRADGHVLPVAPGHDGAVAGSGPPRRSRWPGGSCRCRPRPR